jgi:hypothetical protein
MDSILCYVHIFFNVDYDLNIYPELSFNESSVFFIETFRERRIREAEKRVITEVITEVIRILGDLFVSSSSSRETHNMYHDNILINDGCCKHERKRLVMRILNFLRLGNMK